MKYAIAGTAEKIALQKKKVLEAKVLGVAVVVNLITIVLQILVLQCLVLSMALQTELIHTTCDLLVNAGALWIAYKAITMPHSKAEQIEKRFMYWGLVAILVLAAWTASEAIEKIGAPPALQGGWLIFIGAIGGLGNFIAHFFLDKVPHAERSHKHKLVHLHVIEDMFLAGIVVLSGGLSMAFGWNAADPYLSLLALGWVCKRAYNIYQGLASGKKLGCCHH